MPNVLLEKVEYKIEKTKLGTWRRYGYVTGMSFHEFKSDATFMGLPLIHYTFGRNPETGRRVVAKGVIAVGRFACGIVAIGHVSFGLVAVGQLAIGILFGLAQLATGLAAIGQGAIGLYFGLGQFATGHIAIGQFAIGTYVLAQAGLGKHVLSMASRDEGAIEFFKTFFLTRNFFH
jgi:hypothetical protein